MLKKDFIARSEFPEISRAVINQMGGWESFKEDALEIANHGAMSGWHGFIYYSDTCAFYKKHKNVILRAFQEQSESLGAFKTMAENLQSFRCLDITIQEAEAFLTGLHGGDSTDIMNAFAFWALEETAYCYQTILEE